MKVEYHRSTATDLNEAIAHYEADQPGLGAELRSEIQHAVNRISESPFLYPIVRGEIRRCLAHRFPFSILYRVVANDRIRILVIRHHRRRESFGMGRR